MCEKTSSRRVSEKDSKCVRLTHNAWVEYFVMEWVLGKGLEHSEGTSSIT